MLYKYSCADHQHVVMNISDDYFTIKLYRYAHLVCAQRKKSERQRESKYTRSEHSTLPCHWCVFFCILHRTHWPFEETTTKSQNIFMHILNSVTMLVVTDASFRAFVQQQLCCGRRRNSTIIQLYLPLIW